MTIDPIQINRWLLGLDYFYYCVFNFRPNNNFDFRKSNAQSVIFFVVLLLIAALFFLFSWSVLDVASWLTENWPWDSNHIKSPLNPKVAPMVASFPMALIASHLILREKRMKQVRSRLERERYTPRSWLGILFLVLFVAPAPFMKDYSLAVVGIYTILLCSLDIIGRKSIET